VKPINIKQLQARSKSLHVTPLNRNTFAVASSSNTVMQHVVTVEFDSDEQIHARCTCPWATNGGVACSHVMAALEYLAATRQRKLSFWPSREAASKQKQRVFHLVGSRDEGVWITSRTARQRS